MTAINHAPVILFLYLLYLFFFQSNVWRKRGISLVPCKYSIDYFPLPNYCHISVYEGDGTVSVSTGGKNIKKSSFVFNSKIILGIEMGQGLNTKVAAVVARELGIPLELVSVKPSDNFIEPNNSLTGGSMTSELCVNVRKSSSNFVLLWIFQAKS